MKYENKYIILGYQGINTYFNLLIPKFQEFSVIKIAFLNPVLYHVLRLHGTLVAKLLQFPSPFFLHLQVEG